MGYSFHTPCKSNEARDEMFAFLEEHYRPFSELAAGSGYLGEFSSEEDLNNRSFEHTDSIRGPRKDDLSYVHDKKNCYIGFDMSTSGGAQGVWMKDFCRWMATKVGRLRTFKDVEGKVPYVVYDMGGPDDLWPVLERSQYNVTKEMESYLVDRGFRGWTALIESMFQDHCGFADRDDRPAPKRDEGVWAIQFTVAGRADQYIKAELERLDALWEAQ